VRSSNAIPVVTSQYFTGSAILKEGITFKVLQEQITFFVLRHGGADVKCDYN
jgi:hypothetical protein